VPVRGFTVGEFEARLSRAQSIMRDDGFDALVVCSPHNVRYFSGFDSQFWESPTRPWFIVIPANGAPIAVIPEIGAPAMALTWLDDIRTWPAPRPGDDGVGLLAGVLGSLPRHSGRIGFELGREHSLRMPVMDFLALRDRLDSDLTDGSACLWRIRMVKSQAEIEKIRHICTIASAAYETCRPSFRPPTASARPPAKFASTSAIAAPTQPPSCPASPDPAASPRSSAAPATAGSNPATSCSSTPAPPSTATSATSTATMPSGK
jgi:Xaa-Pro dipeptidase